MNQNLEQLKKLAQIFNTDKLISPEEIQQIFKGIVEILATYKKDTSSINEDTKSVVNKLLEDVISIHKESVDAVEEKKKELGNDFADKLTELRQMVTSIQEEMDKEDEVPEDDTDDEEEKQALIAEIMAQITLPEVKATIVSGEEIVDKINELPLDEDNKIDWARIKNAPKIGKQTITGSPTVLANAVDLDGSTRANNYAIVWDATRGRYTHTAMSGGGTPGGSTTQLQYNNAGAFGGISGATTDGTAVTFATDGLLANTLKSATSAGTLFESNSGTDVLLLGAGGGAGATFYGGVNMGGTLSITGGDIFLNGGNVIKNNTTHLYLDASSGNDVIFRPNNGTEAGRFKSGGDFVVDTNTLYVDATNNRLGIGTASPSYQTDILGNSAGATLNLLRVGNAGSTTNSAAAILITGGGGWDTSLTSMVGTGFIINSIYDTIFKTNGTERMRLVGNGGNAGNLGIATTAPTHTLTLASTGTGIALYNTADQTTNYERGRLYWNSNVLTLSTELGGTGIARSLQLVAVGSGSNATLTITRNSLPTLAYNWGSTATTSGSYVTFSGTNTASSGTINAFAITPTINQSSTAGYTALLVNPTETTTGSGSKLLADFQVGGVSKFSVTNAAVTTISNTSGQTMTFSPVLGGANFPGIELLTTAGNGSFFRANTTSGVQLDMLSNAAVSGIIRTNNSYPLELRTNNTVGLTISTAQVGTFANNSIITANAITATANAATIPVTKGRNIVTNNSAATLTITLTTSGAVNMQTVIVQILDFSAAAQTITFVNTENSTVSVPATTNGSTTLPLTVGFIYNASTSKWRCIASA